jgi:hypothetical protein
MLAGTTNEWGHASHEKRGNWTPVGLATDRLPVAYVQVIAVGGRMLCRTLVIDTSFEDLAANLFLLASPICPARHADHRAGDVGNADHDSHMKIRGENTRLTGVLRPRILGILQLKFLSLSLTSPSADVLRALREERNHMYQRYSATARGRRLDR